MQITIVPKSIPKVAFAHTYETSAFDIMHRRIPDFLEISYIECGKVMRIYDDNETETIQAGSISVMPYLNASHSRSDEYHRHCTVAFDMDFEVADENAQGSVHIDTNINDAKFVSNASTIIRNCTRDILLDPNNEHKLTAHIFELFGLYEHRYAENKFLSAYPDINYGTIRYIKQAKEYIFQHIKDKITVNDIAQHLRISRGYLSEIFKTVCSVSIIKYINEARLETIKNIVLKEHASLAEACETMGIDDPNYVSRMFKKYYGMSLTEMINQNISTKK